MGSWCSMGMEFQFCKIQPILKIDGDDGCLTMCMYLTLKSILKIVKMVKFVVYFTTLRNKYFILKNATSLDLFYEKTYRIM